MTRMFAEATVFNQEVNDWVVSNVADLAGIFLDAFDFDQNLSNWDTGRVVDLSSAFTFSLSFNGDISTWVSYLDSSVFCRQLR